jgi:uncharacterized membrane protein YhaH (DUF805 family)
VFTGRAPRAEYWWYVLATGVAGFCLGLADVLLLHGPIYGNYGVLGLTFVAAVQIPGLAVLVRRLRDSERNGWWALLKIPGYGLILAGGSPFQLIARLEELFPTPILIMLLVAWICGSIALLLFVIYPGTEGTNRYGPDPYGPDALEEVFA